MPVKYITSIQPNVAIYELKDGSRKIRSTNRYYRKKKLGGVVRGTGLAWEECQDIINLYLAGATKASLCQSYDISRYYLKSVLSLHPLYGRTRKDYLGL